MREVKAFGETHAEGLSFEELGAIAQSFTLNNELALRPVEKLAPHILSLAKAMAAAQKESLEGALVMDMRNASGVDFAQNMAKLRAGVRIQFCFKECLALQEDKVKEYIDENIAGLLKNYPHSGANKTQFGYDYLDKLRAFSQQVGKSPRDVFRRAAIEAQRTGFEREVAAQNPGMGKAQLAIKCQEELLAISQEYSLPMPRGRDLGAS